MDRQIAYSRLEIKAFDDGRRTFTGIASSVRPDRMGDIVEPDGAKFALPLPFLYQHNKDRPIGHITAAKVTKSGEIEVSGYVENLPDAPAPLRERLDVAWAEIKSKLIRGLSIGFTPLEYSLIKDGGIRFSSWEWLELSAVTIPANADATFSAIKSFDEAQRRAAIGTSAEGIVRLGITPGDSGMATTNPKGTKMKTIQERITEWQAKRAATVAALVALMQKAADDGDRSLDKAEGEEHDNLQSEIVRIDEHLVRLEAQQKTAKATAKIVEPTEGMTPEPAAATTKVAAGEGVLRTNKNLPKGTAFTRYFCALALSKGVVASAKQIAQQWKDSTPEVGNVLEFVERRGSTGFYGANGPIAQAKTAVAAGNTTDANWASPLVQYDNMASEFVELLRPATLLGKLTLRRVPFNIRFPSQTSGSSMGWVGQGLGKAVSKLQLSTNTLGFAKAAGIVVVTKELAMLSTPDALNLVQTDMRDSMVQFLDEQFIDPGVAAVSTVNPASITNGLTSQNQATGSTLATFEVDLAAALSILIAGEIQFGSVALITDPYTAMKIGMLRDAGGTYAYPGVSMNGGTVMGMPLVTSNSIPHSTSAGSILVLVAQNEIFLADEGGLEVDVSQEASIEMVDNPGGVAASLVSFWQNNLIGVRTERMINWQRRRTAAVTYIDNLHL